MSNGGKKSASYYREYRAKNREKILAQERSRRQAWTPEKRAARLAKKKEWRAKYDPNYGIGRGHGRHKNDLSHMTAEEKIAHRWAYAHEWRENHREQYLEHQREYYRTHRVNRKSKLPARKLLTDEERRARKSRRDWLYRQQNYQKCLEREREAHRKNRDKARKIPYVPALSRRIPWYAENAAHARHIMMIGEERMMGATVNFATAIQSGLTVGCFSY